MINIVIYFFLFSSVEKITIVRELEVITVKEVNSKAIFECELSKTGLKMDWTKDNKPIKSNDKYEITAEGTVHRLVIQDVDAKDVGTYAAEYQHLSTSAKCKVQSKSHH